MGCRVLQMSPRFTLLLDQCCPIQHFIAKPNPKALLHRAQQLCKNTHSWNLVDR